MKAVYKLQNGDIAEFDVNKLRQWEEDYKPPRNDLGGVAGGVEIDHQKKTITWWSDHNYGSGIMDLRLEVPHKYL